MAKKTIPSPRANVRGGKTLKLEKTRTPKGSWVYDVPKSVEISAALTESSKALSRAIHLVLEADAPGAFQEATRLAKIGEMIQTAKGSRVSDFAPQLLPRPGVQLVNDMEMGENPVVYNGAVVNAGGGGLNDQQRILREVMLMLNDQRLGNKAKDEAAIASDEASELRTLRDLIVPGMKMDELAPIRERIDVLIKNLKARAKAKSIADKTRTKDKENRT